MRRWNDKDEKGLEAIRHRLKDELSTIDQHPDTIGDRKLLRFLKGHDYDLDVTCDFISKYILWRKENNIDSIRNEILRGGCDHPSKFPHGHRVMRLIPQIVIDHDIRDRFDCPIVFEQYNFRPAEVLAEISLEEYVEFIKYSLEFRSLILEQLSEEQERKKYESLVARQNAGEDISNEEPYGTLCYVCIIRDLNGVGFDHLGSQGQEIIKAVIGIATPNYPELMRKCHLVNAPWLFNTVWWVIKGWLATKTIEKIGVLGSSFLEYLKADIAVENIPAAVGGEHERPTVAFPFDVSEGGMLHTHTP